MSAPTVFSGTRTKLLSSKGLLLKSGVTIDYDGPKPLAVSTAYAVRDILIFNNELYVVNTAHTSSNANINVDILNGNVEKIEDTDNLLKVSSKFATSESANAWLTGTISGYTAGSFPTSAYTTTFIGDVTATNVIDGKYALSVPATTTSVGSLVGSPSVLISTAYSGKTLQLSFDYKIFSGSSFLNQSGTSSNTYHVLCYDITNSTWLQPTNTYGITSLQGTWTGTVQPPTTCAQLKLIILRANNTSGGNATMSCDNFYIGKKIAAIGAAATDWKDFTMTIGATVTAPTKGTISFDQARWRRVGDSMEIRYDFRQTAAGAAGNGTYLFPIPTGYTIDNTKIKGSGTDMDVVVGSFYGYSTASNEFFGTANVYDTTRLQLHGTNETSRFLVGSGSAQLSNAAVIYSFQALVPIQGWSSGVTMSSDNGASLSVAAYIGATTTLTVGGTTVLFPTKIDQQGDISYNTSTGVITVNSPGDYPLSVFLKTAATAGTGSIGINIVRTGSVSETVELARTAKSSTSTAKGVTGFKMFKALAGDAFTIQGFDADSTALVSESNFSMFKLQNPSAIAQSDNISASYYMSANQTTAAQINFDTKEWDSHSAVEVGVGVWKFRAPEPGEYEIKLMANAASSYRIYLYKSGVKYKDLGLRQGVANVNFPFTTNVKLLAGQYIDIQPNASNTFIGGTLNGDLTSYINIKKIGNY